MIAATVHPPTRRMSQDKEDVVASGDCDTMGASCIATETKDLRSRRQDRICLDLTVSVG